MKIEDLVTNIINVNIVLNVKSKLISIKQSLNKRKVDVFLYADIAIQCNRIIAY